MKKRRYAVIHSSADWVRRNWIGILAATLAIIVLATGAPAWAAAPAANSNQTVPRPTPTSEGSPDPTSTPRPRDDDDGDSDAGGGGDSGQPLPGGAQSDDPTVGLFATPEPARATGLTAVITVPVLNIRLRPSPDGQLLGTSYLNETVSVLSRNEDGTWWLICCVSGTETVGWASTDLLAPNFDIAQAATLIPVDPSFAAPVAAAAQDPTNADTTTTSGGAVTDLQVQITQDPPFTWQGQQFDLQYLVTNPSDVEAVRVELSSEAPLELEVLDVLAAGDGDVRREPGNNDAPLFVIRWPSLAPQETASATITFRMAPEIEDGEVIRNFVVVRANNAPDSSESFRIGLPPASLPDFN